jgi:hypothetical protein
MPPDPKTGSPSNIRLPSLAGHFAFAPGLVRCSRWSATAPCFLLFAGLDVWHNQPALVPNAPSP